MRQMLFLACDLRRKYAEDILTALALPPGALLQFRYDSKYVAPSARRILAEESLAGIEAVIGFVSGVYAGDSFLLPVRYAAVNSVEVSAGFYLVRFKVGAMSIWLGIQPNWMNWSPGAAMSCGGSKSRRTAPTTR